MKQLKPYNVYVIRQNKFSSSASDEVVVYGTNLEVYSNDAFLGFPVDVLGMEYYTVSHHPTTKECEFMVIGKLCLLFRSNCNIFSIHFNVKNADR